ncbi:hypothetical protein ACKVMT_17555 [Halobacteriales archaeon Cl-PHB]
MELATLWQYPGLAAGTLGLGLGLAVGGPETAALAALCGYFLAKVTQSTLWTVVGQG